MSATFMQCPVCGAPVVVTDQGLVYCPICDPQQKPDATREHWGYLMGLDDHSKGQSRDDVPFLAGSEAARCWLAGWDAAEREDIAESHRDKIATEQSFWSQEEMRNAV